MESCKNNIDIFGATIIINFINYLRRAIMEESAVYNERRQHQRSIASSGIIAVLIASSPEIIGSVSDISLGGAKITYHKPTNTELDYTGLKIDLISDDRFIEAIPCRNAWDHPLETRTSIPAGELRQCGIQFADMNPNQIYLLRSFINRCAATGITSKSQPQASSSLDQ
jgi:c-di-GMP-binding flagellar brake protein YcgR